MTVPFSKFALIPIKVNKPSINIDSLRFFVQNYCDLCHYNEDNTIRMIIFMVRKPVINGELIQSGADKRFRKITSSSEFDWDPSFHSQFPGIVEWILELPFKNLYGIDLVTQTNDVPAHLDIFRPHSAKEYFNLYKDIEPMFYRAIFSYPNDPIICRKSFFVTERKDEKDKKYLHLPSDTILFAMNSSMCYHGSTYNKGHFKCTLVIHGELDIQKHLELLSKSFSYYKEYSIELETYEAVT